MGRHSLERLSPPLNVSQTILVLPNIAINIGGGTATSVPTKVTTILSNRHMVVEKGY